MKRVLIAAAAALLVAGCETATPYQPLGAHNSQASGGYSEQQIEGDRWRVSFAGNSLTARERVERYLLFRAAQLTTENGYDWFQTADRHTDQQTSYYGDADPYFAGWGGPYWGFYRRGFGWGYGYWGDPFWGGPLDVQQVSQYTATVEIVMGHGPKPPNPHAYDARAVIQHLQGTIKYPETKS
jgi:hypothetical protein